MAGFGRHGIRSALAALAVSAALTAGSGVPAVAAPGPGAPKAASEHYVSLGDSYTSGPLIPAQVHWPCLRSNRNYPSLAHQELGFGSFTDVSCGGAKTDDMWSPQPGKDNPAQLDAVGKDTTLVSLGIGGNDIGFDEIIGNCIRLAAGSKPGDKPCEDFYTEGGTDRLAERIAATAPKVAAVLAGIRERAARHARVLVVGFPALATEDGRNCRLSLGMANDDVPYLVATEKRLNAMLRQQAESAGARYVDTYGATTGHDACQAPRDRWIEGLIPLRPALAFHPNDRGEQAMAGAFVEELARPRH